MVDLNMFETSTKVQFCTEDNDCFNATVRVDNRDANETKSEIEITSKDATWILTSAIIIFTMQTGKNR